ncbi:MAG: IS3 family transposase [Methylococcales bacterium]
MLGYSRQAYYQRRRLTEKEIFEGELVIQEVIRIRRMQKRIGTRKLMVVMEEFMCEHNIAIGRDALFELLRRNKLLVRKRGAAKPRTTLSHSWMRRFPNLIRDFIPAGANQLWVSDITYVRIGGGFGYLSLVTDAYSRKIVGFCLSRDLRAAGCIRALKMALKNNPNREGLIHHSDRGLQYQSAEYLRLLGPKARISMSENSDPLENAIAERVNGILKDELLKARFDSFAQAQAEIALAVSTYNHLRPHSSVDMLTPAIAHTRTGVLKRRWKNYYRPKTTQEASYAAV